jgi:hypothetical protein
MARAAKALLLCAAALLAGCPSTTPHPPADPPEPVPAPSPFEDDDDDDDEPYDLRPAQLMPMRPGRVTWYRATFYDPPRRPRTRRIAFVSMWDKASGNHLESVGLGDRQMPMRLVRRHERLYVFPGGLGERGYDFRLRGLRAKLQNLETPAGPKQAVLLEHQEGSLDLRHWFAPETGLVRYEINVNGESALTLEILEELSQGTPKTGYPTDTPAAFWSSYTEAIRRVDVQRLEHLLAPSLARRVHWPAKDVARDLEPDRGLLSKARVSPQHTDLLQERIRSLIPDLLDVQLTPAGAWAHSEADDLAFATAPAHVVAWLDGVRSEGTGEIVLCRPGGDKKAPWRLAEFRRR